MASDAGVTGYSDRVSEEEVRSPFTSGLGVGVKCCSRSRFERKQLKPSVFSPPGCGHKKLSEVEGRVAGAGLGSGCWGARGHALLWVLEGG